jgi:hypothetical protein
LEETVQFIPNGVDVSPGVPSPRRQPCQPHEESGVLRTSIKKGSRPGAALILCGAVLIVPLLLMQNGPDAAASPTSKGPGLPKAEPAHGTELALHARTGRHARRHLRATTTLQVRTAPHAGTASVTTSTGTAQEARLVAKRKVALLIRSTRAAARSAPAGSSGTLLSLHQAGAAVEATPPSEEVVDRGALGPTTTMSPPTTEAIAPPPAAPPAAPYEEGEGQVTYYDHPAGTCASPWLPFGTVVEVTNPANGESVSCVVNDREADTSRSIDLATATFAEIAPLSQGVISAELSW